MKKQIIRRSLPEVSLSTNLHPLLERIYVARGIRSQKEFENGLENLEPFHLLTNIHEAVACLYDALKSSHHIMVIGDFDVDGATSTTLAVQCLQLMGATKVSYLVPNRFKYGYGLTPEIVDVAAKSMPNILLTVDNGISSQEGVERAHERGMKVIVTDHHLPALSLPDADAIVNPNLPGDLFHSKNLAGVGVIFYVMTALRAKLREMNWFEQRNIPEFKMTQVLDLVALGTVADVVPLDRTNRILVHQGLLRMRMGRTRPGIRALIRIAGRKLEQISAGDLGYALAPRLNAAGRLTDMSLGIECLLAVNEREAVQYALKLDALNKERQQIEKEMHEQAMTHLNRLQLKENLPLGVCLFDSSWHQGIIGILASRIKDLIHRPVFAFASMKESQLKGSGRSIPGVHLRDVLETIANRHPELTLKFGGHAMAAGISLPCEQFEFFSKAFNQVISEKLSVENLQGIIHSDGTLMADSINLETAKILQEAGPWGQGFPEPIFDGQFKVITHQILKEKHLKLVLRCLDNDCLVDAIAFNVEPEKRLLSGDDSIHAAYRLGISESYNKRNLQLVIEYFEIGG
jgi:single-stranded-DNA-specific exonuclease